MLHAGFRGRQTDEILRHEIVAHEVFIGRRTAGDVPARRDVNGQNGNGGVDDGREDSVEGGADGRVETEPEQGVDYQVCRVEGAGEVLGRREEGDVEMAKLFLEAGEDGCVGRFGVVD